MFSVDEASAAAIRQAFESGGELAATAELRRLFPGISANAGIRDMARRIAAWPSSSELKESVATLRRDRVGKQR
jgi:hypothetical protein